MSLLNQITDLIHAADGATAIEMTPQAHASLVMEVLNNTANLEMGLKFIAGLPIIFVHGSAVYFKLLNNEQYKLRQKHNEYLKKYKEKYTKMISLINNSHKVNDFDAVKQIYEKDLVHLVRMLNDIEKKLELSV